MTIGKIPSFVAAALMGLSAFSAAAAPADIKIGILNTSASGPVYIAIEKGYFAAEDLAPNLVVFDAAQPIAVATASGDLDIGTSGLTAAMYALAAQGTLRIIGAQVRESPGFHTTAFIASNSAYEAGLKTVKDLPGHLVAIPQIGSSYQYALSLLGPKYGLDLSSIKYTAVQSMPNIGSAVAGDKADAGILNTAVTMPLLDRGQIKLLAWVGDEAPFQIAGLWTSTKLANSNKDYIDRFLRAYKKGAKDFHDAFTGAYGTRQDQASAPEIYAILQKYVKLSLDQIKLGISYHDPEARLDVKDVRRQIEWFVSQGMLKGNIDVDTMIDKRYAVALP
jgi:NitT/TauT family transport system substrate-binding protein